MSLGYAEKLSYIEDVGQVGMDEFFDSPHVLQDKIEQLAVLIRKSKHLVVFTGAGISTSCGIPDFRGPKGIWTLQRDGKALPKAALPFSRAMPGITHMALVELQRANILKFVISQVFFFLLSPLLGCTKFNGRNQVLVGNVVPGGNGGLQRHGGWRKGSRQSEKAGMASRSVDDA
ncbi:hypothetical protein KSS87_021264 [Heliosperma pusillum]|nr:hypothetical protein KSS87_021264 [Heliosperma pusillum]